MADDFIPKEDFDTQAKGLKAANKFGKDLNPNQLKILRNLVKELLK